MSDASLSPPKFIAYCRLIRLPNSFTAISNIIAAYGISTGFNGQIYPLILLLISTLCLYHGGMILNDCFDIVEDRRDRPNRPIPAGQISVNSAWILGFVLLCLGLVSAALVSNQTFIIAAALIFCILIYNGLLKNHVTGTVVMGACRYLNWCLGMSAAAIPGDYFLIPLVVFLYIVSLTLLSRVETTADTKKPLIACMLLLFIDLILVIVMFIEQVFIYPWALVVFIVGFIILVRKARQLYRNFAPEKIQLMMMTLIMGIIPLDAALVLAVGDWWLAICIFLLIFPGRFLACRLYVT